MLPSASPKASYPYAITGAVMLLVAVAAIGAAYTVPFGDMRLRTQDYEATALMEYGIMGMDVEAGQDGESTSEHMSWRDPALDGGPQTPEFRTGFWMVPIGGLIMLAAAMFLLAAPSSGPLAARIGAAVGIVGAIALAVGAIAFLLAYSDTTEFAHEELQGAEGMMFDGRSLRAGAIWMGAGIVLGLGGSVLGFSDKPATRRNPAIATD